MPATDKAGPLRRRSMDGLEAVSIVVAESDPETARRIQTAFRMIANEIEVLTTRQQVEDYIAGIKRFRGGWDVPDVLIVDVDMLGEHCPWTLKRMRQKAEGNRPIIVAVTGEPSTEESAELVDSVGIFGYVPKPLGATELMNMVHQIEGLALYLVRTPRER